MAIVTRFFSTTGAGTTDGTTWANRAALFSAGNWSTVITGFDFSAADTLRCLIGPGSYTCSQALASALFTTAPTAANSLFLFGCDSSGALLAPPDPNWTSDQAAWDDSTLPVIATTTNISTISLGSCFLALLKFTASGRNGVVVTSASGCDWIVVINTTANIAAIAYTSNNLLHVGNSVFKCSGSAYDTLVSASSGALLFNCRLAGVMGTSGNRRGITATNNVYARLCTIVNNGGEGYINTGVSTTQSAWFLNCVVANNGATGIKPHSTAAQTGIFVVSRCMVTGNGAYGIDAQSGGRTFTTGNRLRDNVTANFNGLGNYPTDLNNLTTDSDDATEYVNVAGGDFRIKSGAAIHGQGYGVSDQVSAGGGRRPRLMTMS